MPPGGFEDVLPPSFGRHSGKGEMSNVNLRAKQMKASQIRKRRRKLRVPQTSSSTPTLGQVKKELFELIKQTRVARGESPSKQNASIGIHISDMEMTSPMDSRSLPGGIANDDHRDEDERIQAPSITPTRTYEDEDTAPLSDFSAAHGAATAASPASFLTVTPQAEEAWTSHEDAVEHRYAVTPTSTVFGSDLDRLERDMLREYHQRGTQLPPPDRVFAEFGAGRRGKRHEWTPSSSFAHLRSSDFRVNRKSEGGVGDNANRNLAAYHLFAEAYQTQQEERRRALGGGGGGKGHNLCRGGEDAVTGGDAADLPASENPHFPTEAAEGTRTSEETSHEPGQAQSRKDGEAVRDLSAPKSLNEIVINARTDYKSRLTTVSCSPEDEDANRMVYDAYHQRPADHRLPEVRGADYWSSHENRRRVEERSAYRAEAFAREILQEGAVDTSEVEYSVNRVRKETLLYFQAHPINEMIQEPFVRIRQFAPPGGGGRISFNPYEPLSVEMEAGEGVKSIVESVNMDVDIPVQEARRMAQELGLDLIRIGAIYSQKTDRRIVALCLIGDHREHMRDMIKFKIQKLGVQPPPTKECIEVPFKGGTHPHAIRFKCVGVAKHLLHRHAVRINLTKFGTPREGFPVLQSIFDELKRQCLQLKAYHTAGQIRWNYDEIYCYLYPSTGRSPKTTVTHPSPQEVLEARDDSVLENEKEVYFDDLHEKVTQKQRLQYMLKLEKGTAWADKDEGMSLQRQRALKVMLGYLPKGNKDIYAARGDVNITAPFRASHATSVERWSYPSESNLEQASRGAAALGKRAGMPISEMHDQGETAENPTQLDRFYYTAQGPALEMGEFKEALGLKNNRTKQPPVGPGFATLGTKATDSGASGRGFATK
ncbi:hypothetical protein ABB37_02688 [Leptomonas pyrrhocoris]|uniref:Uncharacterized protein n=1 Tax=Leptomonas pyrrhocoris TaxID=157538 RepID=A0A0M9G5M4_LEPPY|nr:hypothetical protein ABB37_02688 [Leptomonas pyrrhocoris]KPA82940.1 hypothetical protein ABB37_02688 [Leptomonas pyrrhocoris]|eukprot:XP_015661379.1 hypothetical protein ABB37_02688 [Leptomonas pyrrhocoris]